MKQSIFLFLFLIFSSFGFSQGEEYWEPHAAGLLPEEYGIFSVSVVNEDVIWAAAWDQSIENFIRVDHEIKILKTFNGGESWQVYSVDEFPARLSFDIHAIDEYTAWMTTHDYNQGLGPMVVKTEDGGETWKVKLQEPAAGVHVRFFNQNDGFIGNFPYYGYTEDGGINWTTDSLENFWTNEGVIIGSGNNSCAQIGNNLWIGTSRGRVGRSEDKGKTWEFHNVGLGTGSQIVSVAFKDEMNGMALGNSLLTRFSKTTDGGKTWTPLGPTSFIFAHNLEYVPGTSGTFIACTKTGRPNPVSAYTTDFGTTWQTVTKNFPFGGVNFDSPNVGWAGIGWIEDEETPAMVKWISTDFSGVFQREAPSFAQVFPNPAADVLRLNFPDGYEADFIKIHNAVGQEVISTSEIESGEPIDVSFLPKGVYYLKVIGSKKELVGTFVKN